MPGPELTARYDKAVMWEFAGRYDSQGQPKVKDVPISLEVRWNDVESEALDRDGNTITLSAQVVVDRKITPGSVMWKGDIADLPSADTFSPDDDGSLHQVVRYNGTKDVKGRAIRQEVSLMRFKGSLPNQVT